jgi:exonuclease SbcC
MQNDLQQDKEGLVKLTGVLVGCSERAESLKNQVETALVSLIQELQKLGFRDEAECMASKLNEKTRLDWIEEQNKLHSSIHANRESLARNHKALEVDLARQLTMKNAEDLEQQKADSEKQLGELQRKSGEIDAELKRHRENEMTLADRKVDLERQLAECERWQSLSRLIGSADGKSYRNFVQGLTFERLIAYSNQQLSEMTDRYLLVASKDAPLELNVIDNYQASAERTTKNLSGGESFIMSLALALGLSRMASQKIRVDSLFMDEGFGTLDEESLNMALDTLSALQQEGKVIGVISHVKALKERIATQIVVSSAGMGRSKLHGPGCSLIRQS